MYKVSNEYLEKLKKDGNIRIVSFLPCDTSDCDCFGIKNEWMDKLAKMESDKRIEYQQRKIDRDGVIECPRAKGKKKYKVICRECGATVAYINADDIKAKDWCNLHYVNEAKLHSKSIKIPKLNKKGLPIKRKGRIIFTSKKEYYGQWHGCATLQVSPFDNKLGFECFCGNDTRDFRVRSNLTGKELASKLKENMIDRDFSKNSKFYLEEVK